jgi:hypothetical protein
MIKLSDMNQSWVPPEGYEFCGVAPYGSYLMVVYVQKFWDNPLRHGQRTIAIYLQDTGREVLRTTEEILDPVRPEPTPEPLPVGRWFRFYNGFLLALQGLQEMYKCRKRS